jgi:hypothetical protein
VCIACVMNTQPPASPGLEGPGELAEWSPGETAKAMIVCRQLPRWSRQLFDLLSSAPGRRFPRSAVQASLAALGDASFTVEDACHWATATKHPPPGKPCTGWTSPPRTCSTP